MIVSAKLSRNEPCPCGSGKKYKNCHGNNMNDTRSQWNERVTKKPDGTLEIAFNIPPDELGPPFGYTELICVPVFDEGTMKPGEKQPSPTGSPGQYEVAFIFAKPEIALAEMRYSDIDSDSFKGDSSFIIASPEPRKATDPAFMKMDYSYDAADKTRKTGTIEFRPNKHGRLSFARTTIYSNGYRQARLDAYRAILPMLSNLSFECDIPLEIKGSTTREISSGGVSREIRFQFPCNTLQGPGNIVHRKEIYALQSFYREGMNSSSICYSFLCFYRVLEAIYKMRQNIIEQKSLRPKFKGEARVEEADLKGLPIFLENNKKFIGRKYRDIYEKELTPLRILIAHGLLGDDDPFENTPDNVDIRTTASSLIPITKIIARLEIQNELNVEYIPIQDKKESTKNDC